ncbi:MAG: dihydroorotase [Deltaproteobacteria bacterium]|nr:dihydroorotase [Deltaproteobacteria bacterium]
MMLLIKGARLVDPLHHVDKKADMLVDRGKIVEIKNSINVRGADVLVATNLIVCPGFIDIHTHLREPGEEFKETIESGCEAAACGGFTAIACMPNTIPPNDNPSTTRFIMERARMANGVRVMPIGAITIGQKGEQLCEYFSMKREGIIAISEDGRSVMNSGILRRAMEYAATHDLLVISHCEDHNLSGKGVMNEGIYSTRYGLRPIPTQAEDIIVYRDVALSALAGCRLHIAHVSAADSLFHIRRAKKRGLRVTAETAPHYLYLSDDMLATYDTNLKVNPPLRSRADVQALRKAIKDGTIDCIASDHAPHSSAEKDVEFDIAKPGISGIETSVGLVLNLVNEGVISLKRAIYLLSAGPAKVLNIPPNSLSVGSDANITIVDLKKEWTVDPSKFHSKGRNTPFAGYKLRGKAVATLVAGRILYSEL